MKQNPNQLSNSHDELSVQNVSCWKGDKCIFQHIGFTLKAGELTQLEGHNGAGKTSLIRILAGLSQPEEGHICWREHSIYETPAPYHATLLYIGHKPGLKDVLTARENLAFYQATVDAANPQDVQDALIKVGLQGFEDTPVKQLSAGQQRRVALARLYLSKAKVWLLDEPFTAIDKQGVVDLINLFKQHCQNGGIILFTSHQHVDDPMLKRISLAAKEEDYR